MKLAKTGKLIILFILTLALSLIAGLSVMTFPSVYADTASAAKASNYFYLNGGISENVRFVDEDRTATGGGKIVATVKDGDVLKARNKLAVKELALNLELSNDIASVTVSYKGTSKYATGVKGDNGYSTNVVSKLVVDTEAGTAKINDGVSQTFSNALTSITFIDDNNATVNGASVSSTAIDNFAQKVYNGDTRIIDLEFSFTLKSGVTEADFSLASINTDNGNANTNQTFDLDEDGALASIANPVVVFPTDKFAMDGNAIVAERNYVYENFNVKSYSLIEGSSSSVTLEPVNASNVNYSQKNNVIRFTQVADATAPEQINCKIDDTTVLTISVVVKDSGTDENAPVYNTDAAAKQRFEDTFKSKLVKEGEYGDADAIYVSIGSNRYLDLPSFEDLVSDETTPYSGLDYTVYYKTPISNSSRSDLRIPLDAAGDYSFYVVFKDTHGNAMTEKDFYTQNSEDDNDVQLNMSKYGNLVFTFSIKDNAPIEVTKAGWQGKGFVGIKYNASKFTVVASSYNEQYTLLYSANKNAADEDWVVIPKASTVTDKQYNKDGFSYDDIKSIGYNGTYSFTPDRAGYYKITCKVESDVLGRSDEATTDIIEVTDRITTVKPDSKWLQNNVWSVVFLSVGTLCLIGIVVLLFVKPKDAKKAADKKETAKK